MRKAVEGRTPTAKKRERNKYMETRKQLKAKKLRKDYEKKRNIAQNAGKYSLLRAGDGILPKSKKIRLSKKTLTTQKKAQGNAIRTATNY